MLKLEYTYLLTLAIVQGVLFIGYVVARKKSKSKEGKVAVKLSDLDVVVPFRDEEYRLENLLNSIAKQKVHPNHYFFVDDHSSDKSVELIHSKLSEKIAYSVLSMDTNETGKKRAIRKGISESQAQWILTMDADVNFFEGYFQTLSETKVYSLTILPVMMTGKKWLQRLFSADYNLSNFVNYAVFGWTRPIMASGANLLFNKKAFTEVDSFENHESISSGDDMFLLRDFHAANKDVGVVLEGKLRVETKAPNSFMDFFSQRVRWIAKTKFIKDAVANSIGVLFVLLNVFLIVTVAVLLQKESATFLLLFIAFKMMIECVSISVYIAQFKRVDLMVLFPLIQFTVPISSFMTLVLSFFWSPKWKGRRSVSPKYSQK